MDEQKRTPAYVAYKTFKNTVMGMDHVADTVDHSAFQSMNGSTRSYFFGALKFFGLIDDRGTPSAKLHQLAGASDAEWKTVMGELIKSCYSPVQLQALGSGTIAALKKSFGDGVGASVVAPACRFLIAAAKDVGIPVSPTVEKAKVGRGSSPRKKRTNGRGTPRNGGNEAKKSTTPDGIITFPIHIPGLPPGSITVSEKISAKHLTMFHAMVAAVDAYAKAQSEAGGVDDKNE